jgi:hypothetical protein
MRWATVMSSVLLATNRSTVQIRFNVERGLPAELRMTSWIANSASQLIWASSCTAQKILLMIGPALKRVVSIITTAQGSDQLGREEKSGQVCKCLQRVSVSNHQARR